jgi:hypothetical protein
MSSDCKCKGAQFWLPLNTKINVAKDSSLQVQAPLGFEYLGYDSKGKLASLASGGSSISCNCTGTGDCLPGIVVSSSGTLGGCGGSCTKCTMTQTSRDGKLNFATGGFINRLGGVHYITNSKAVIPAAFEALYDDEEAREALKFFIDEQFCGIKIPAAIERDNLFIAPRGFAFAAVSVFGRVVPVLVPTAAARAAGAVSAPAITCNCTDGTCTVKKKGVIVATAYYCEGSCSGTCTISFVNGGGIGGVFELYQSVSFQF